MRARSPVEIPVEQGLDSMNPVAILGTRYERGSVLNEACPFPSIIESKWIIPRGKVELRTNRQRSIVPEVDDTFGRDRVETRAMPQVTATMVTL